MRQAAQGAGDRERPAEEAGGGLDPRQADSGGDAEGKMVSPARRREAVLVIFGDIFKKTLEVLV